MIDEGVLRACAAGDISPEIALARLLLSGSRPDPAALAARAKPGPLAQLAALADVHRDRLDGLSALARAGFDPGENAVAGSAALFDRLAREAPEAGVAFYSFGDAGTLARATAELIAVIRAWAPPAGKRVLDVGCGIGRVALALVDEAAAVTGVDVAAGMVQAARERAGDRAHVRFEQVNGRDLGHFKDASFDIVLAVDSFPFLVPAGWAAVDRMVADVARVLAPGGDFLVFNWSYRGDLALDERDVRALGSAHGLALVRSGERPFAIWDGMGFHLRQHA